MNGPGVMLITGGGRGIGAATARLAAQRGYAVCVNYLRDRSAAEKLAAEIGGGAIAVAGDVSAEADVLRLFETVDAKLGRLAALVNNAGIVDRQSRVYVADRENSRVQVFTGDGKLVAIWTDVARPMQVVVGSEGQVFVAEVGWRAGRFPWQTPPPGEVPGARVSVFDSEGRLLVRWGGAGDPCAPGEFFAPHDLTIDSRGDLYVGEVVMSAGGKRGEVPASCHALQKFVRVGP